MKEKIESVFNALQELDMKPTPNNVSIMDGVFSVLRDVYQELKGAEDGRAAADPDGRDND